jgi:hypothetical protein
MATAPLLTLVSGIVAPGPLGRHVQLLHNSVKIAPSNLPAFGAFPVNASLTGLFCRLLTDGYWVRPLVVAPGLASCLVLLTSRTHSRDASPLAHSRGAAVPPGANQAYAMPPTAQV